MSVRDESGSTQPTIERTNTPIRSGKGRGREGWKIKGSSLRVASVLRVGSVVVSCVCVCVIEVWGAGEGKKEWRWGGLREEKM